MKIRIPFYFILIHALLAAGCNSGDGERFTNQQEDYVFSSTSSTLTAYGASQVLPSSVDAFRCPSISGMRSESNLTVFYAQANSYTPHFTLKSIAGIRSDTSGGFGISLMDLPIGFLDIYERCNSTTYEKLLTSCPPEYTIVKKCSDASKGLKECVQRYNGTHRLVAYSTVTDDKECHAETYDRSPYTSSVPDVAYACDAFSPVGVPAVIRGTVPTNNCCSEEELPTFDFCIKPCGCRTLNIEIVPKEEALDSSLAGSSEVNKLDDVVRIGVFSNVEGHKDKFIGLLESMNLKNVNIAVNLGNLTKDGSESQYTEFRNLVRDNLLFLDGTLSESGIINETCKKSDQQICCDETPGSESETITSSGRGRLFTSLCNVLIGKIAFMTGLGEDEYKGNIDVFRKYFGPSNFITSIGKVEFIMLDTSDAGISDVERKWLEDALKSSSSGLCRIPKPTQFEEWPTLAECHDILGKDDVTCRECIQQEAYCIPPDADRAETSLGPENCICVPATSKVCPGNLKCEQTDGLDHNCICTRDQDCGHAGSCVDGVCKPPVRLVFSYTPLFDKSGGRNNAFVSKKDAAGLLSLFVKYGVNAVFSGKVRDYQSFSMGGIPMYITGGGGADMASFASKPNHWLLVEIPKGYTNPDPKNIKVSVITF